jgi:hypothetical protein
MVAGMTPSTVKAGFVGAVLDAGYHIELAGGGHYNAAALRSKIAEIQKLIPAGVGITLNSLYINPRQFTFQFPLWQEMRKEAFLWKVFALLLVFPLRKRLSRSSRVSRPPASSTLLSSPVPSMAFVKSSALPPPTLTSPSSCSDRWSRGRTSLVRRFPSACLGHLPCYSPACEYLSRRRVRLWVCGRCLGVPHGDWSVQRFGVQADAFRWVFVCQSCYGC